MNIKRLCLNMVFKLNYHLMQVENIAECSKGGGGHSAILSTFIKLPCVIKIFVLSIFEWPFYTGFTVYSVLNLSLSFNSVCNASKIY